MSKKLELQKTPLQRVIGFDVAEEVYDMLPLTAQSILDLKIEGYREVDIAEALGIPRTTIFDIFQRTRYTLLKTRMRTILEARIHYRETSPIVMDKEE